MCFRKICPHCVSRRNSLNHFPYQRENPERSLAADISCVTQQKYSLYRLCPVLVKTLHESNIITFSLAGWRFRVEATSTAGFRSNETSLPRFHKAELGKQKVQN